MSDSPIVVLSIAHTEAAPGAASADGRVVEHPVSRRICAAAADALAAAGVESVTVEGSIRQKIAKVNKIRASCLVEPHLNAAENHSARGHLVLHHAGSTRGRLLAIAISDAVEAGLRGDYPSRRIGAAEVPGRYARHHSLPILSETHPPAVIPELLFVSNEQDAAFLAREDAPERLGRMVAAGVVAWLKGGS